MEISILGTRLRFAIRKHIPAIQLLRVMKLTACILIVACIHVSANSYSQTVSFSGKNVPIQSLFNSIEKQTGFSFFFNYALIKDTKPVTLDVVNVPMQDVLLEVLNVRGLDFYQTGKTVFIVKRQNLTNTQYNDITSSGIGNQLINVTGKVINMQGEVLAGASISLKNQNRGTLTDEKGIFEMKNVPYASKLEVSYAGYQKKEIAAVSGMMSVQLVVSTNQLDEMQVIAYGQTNARMSIGDVTTVKAVDIEKQPISNPLSALEGRVPGMFIAQGNGLSAGAMKVQIRGQNSISSYAGNDPLYIIDGVPYTSQLLPGLNNILGSSGSSLSPSSYGSSLSFINPADIESISVLKDADATSIYGSRAANGAILITTKKGKIGRTSVDLNARSGWGQVSRRLSLMNTQQYLAMRHEGIGNDKLVTGTGDYDINGTWDTTRNIDWQKVLIGGMAQYNDINTSVSGGEANLQYLIGATFHRETTVYSNDLSERKGAIHFSINNISPNKKFRTQITGSYLIDNNRLPQLDLTSYAMTLPSNAPPLYLPDGELNWALSNTGTNTWINPLKNFSTNYIIKTNNLISNAILSYQILPGLSISSSFGYTNMQSNESMIFPSIAVTPQNRSIYVRSARFGFNNINSWIVEPQLLYKRKFLKGTFDALLGATINQNNSNGLQITGSGQTSDQLLYDIKSATTLSIPSTTSAVYKYNAAFGRLSYNWNDQYLINLSIRRDGSSRFGSENQFHNFASVGAAWVFSNLNWTQKTLPFLSFGKFRGSYGTTGSDQIGDYKFMNLYSVTNYLTPYQGISSLGPNGLSNPYLQWQNTKKLEFGTDIGLLNDRIIFNLNYYRNRCSNQLLAYPTPNLTGFGVVILNLPATVQNAGWEFLVTTINLKSKLFSWTTSINVSTSSNKLIAFPNLSTSSYSTYYIIGQPINYAQVYHYMGVNSSSGLYQFSDGKGGTTSMPETNPLVTRTTMIRTAPAYFGGISNSFRYKGFSIDVFLQFVKQKGPNYYFGTFFPGVFNGGTSNQPTWLIDRWKMQGDDASHQKFSSNFTGASQLTDAQQSDAAYTDASYIRLKNLSISWQIPERWQPKSIFQKVRVYIQGQNLLIFTHYKGLDPETLSSSSLPTLRVFAGGIQILL